MSLITSDQIKQYNQDGYVIVDNVFSEQELKPVLKEVEYDNARGRSDKDEFDSKNIEGAWMKRWKK